MFYTYCNKCFVNYIISKGDDIPMTELLKGIPQLDKGKAKLRA